MPRADDKVDVWTSGEEGYHTYRIPAVMRAPDGALLAFCEGRKVGRGDSGDIDLLMKRSDDGGASWGEQRVLWDDGDNVCGNPCPVLDRDTGMIFLFLTHNLGHDRESEIIAGTSEGTRTVWVMTSADGGSEWSPPREVSASTKRRDWTWYATGPGVGIQLEVGPHAGRLVIPCDHIEADSQRYYSHVLLSDDHGATWRIGGRSKRDQLNECQVAELDSGELVLNMRNYNRQKRARAVARSKDGGESFGEVTWDEELPEPICQAGMVTVRAGRGGGVVERWLAFSNPASPNRRERMLVRVSYDGGLSWHTAALLHGKAAAYSCLVDLSDGNSPAVGCLFERGREGPYERITFQRVKLSPPHEPAPSPVR
ncbi:glycoside hydrolase [Planctomycetota bacterium]|nr:glycoside hydrolase [Planctomycetota bacterium]